MTKNWTFIAAALIIIAVAVGSFIYSLARTDPPYVSGITEDGVPYVDPSGSAVPDGPPNMPVPTTPPPGE